MRRTVLSICTAAAVTITAGCDGDSDKEPIKIGLSASLTGFDAEFGATAQLVTEGAVAELNAAGGINGHPLELLVEDDGSDLGADGGRAEDAIQALIDGGAVAIIGPFLSGLVRSATPTITEAEIVLVSPSSTAPDLADADDDGFMFRTAPNDNFQVLAMAHYFADIHEPPLDSFAILHEEGDYGVGLRDELISTWVTTRGETITGTAIAYPTGLTASDTASDAAWASVVALAPTTLVVIGQGSDTNALVHTWIESGQLPDLEWFFADGSKISSFFGNAADSTLLPATAAGLRGTAPTSPKDSLAYATYLDAFEIDLNDQAYFPNTWDAVYLIAAGLVQQQVDSPDAAAGGEGLRDAIEDVSKGGQIFTAAEWRGLVSQIRAGGDVDYDGASGPVDFRADGETISPYEVWETEVDGTTWSFNQILYMETADLTAE